MLFRRLRMRLRIPIELTRELNTKVDALVEGSANESRLLSENFKALIEGINNQSKLLNAKLSALVEGSANGSRLLNEKFEAMIDGLNNQSELLNSQLNALITALNNQSRLLNVKLDNVISALNVRSQPLRPNLVAEKTYNTSHPGYDATVVRNYPGKIFNSELPCTNPVFAELKKFAKGDILPDEVWAPLLQSALAEARTVPHAELVLQRRDALEQHFAELGSRYNARYLTGSVNFEDALFLYWLVRKLKPKTIVQCGVCNGLSSAFIMLALAKNGPDGRLYAIDLPPVFNPKEADWTVPGKTYGIVIPEGKTSGWIVPEAYRQRFEVQNGDSRLLLPQLVDRLISIDMFFHDSDHNYNHMMFEFREAKRKLVPRGLVVADDISWNASLWDFAEENRVPAYNFKGAVGAVFF